MRFEKGDGFADGLFHRRGFHAEGFLELATVEDEGLLKLVEHLHDFTHAGVKQSKYAQDQASACAYFQRLTGLFVDHRGELALRYGRGTRNVPDLSIGLVMCTEDRQCPAHIWHKREAMQRVQIT